jgi:hypothetical protein
MAAAAACMHVCIGNEQQNTAVHIGTLFLFLVWWSGGVFFKAMLLL